MEETFLQTLLETVIGNSNSDLEIAAHLFITVPLFYIIFEKICSKPIEFIKKTFLT